MTARLLALISIILVPLTATHAVAQDLASDKGKLSYALGYRAGLDVANALASGEQLDMATLIKGLQDAAARKDPAVPADHLAEAMQNLQNRMQRRVRAQLEKRAAENMTRSEAFLAANLQRSGVKALPSGVQYRVLEAGSGSRPTSGDQITVSFRAQLPDGTEIENTERASNGQPAGPVTLRLSEVPLPGLREALQLMSAGSRWEVALPAAQAHGTSIERAGNMAHQALVFDIRLLSVGPAAPDSR